MPRYRRRITEGSVQHLISRFVNRQFLFDVPDARDEYLARAQHAFARTGWTALGYALMSSHVHWLVQAGSSSSDRLMRSLHAGFSGWLNRSTGRLGPVFADRHRNVECEGETALAVLAYIHNNPVRAGVVADPSASAWTSHRAYVGLEPTPAWLNVDRGLSLSGLEPTTRGRAAFHRLVASRASELRRPDLSGANLAQARSDSRKRQALPVELMSPRLIRTEEGLVQEVEWMLPASSPYRPRWEGPPLAVIAAVASITGSSEDEIRSRGRSRRVCAARRYSLLVWVHGLGRPTIEMANALGLSLGAASNHLTRSTVEEQAFARQCVRSLGVRERETRLGEK